MSLATAVRQRLRWREDLGLLFEPTSGTFHRVRNQTAREMVDLVFAGEDEARIAERIAGEYGLSSSEPVARDVQQLLTALLEDVDSAEPAQAGIRTEDALLEIDKQFGNPLAFPLRLEIELTAVCNWNCGFCYNVWKLDPGLNDSDVRKLVRNLPAKHMPKETAFRILDEAADKGCMVMRYSGGETLLHPDAMEIFEYGGRLGLYQVVFTNGHFVTPELATRLSNANVRCVLVSIHGDREKHNELAGHPRAYDKATEAMRILVEAGISVVAEATLVAGNSAEIANIIRDVYRLGVRDFGVMRYVPTGKNDEEYAVPMAEMMPLMEQLDRLIAEECPGLTIGWPCSQKFCTSETDQPLTAGDPTLALRFSQLVGHCESGLVWGSISFDGRLRNCPHANVYFGDVAESGIEAPWTQMTDAVHAAVQTRSSCAGCVVADRCRGGCHLPAFFETAPATRALLPLTPVAR